MIIDVTSKTNRFNLSVVGNDFINDCCFGEDFSNWLVKSLTTRGIDADVICMEDFGWANEASFQGISYLVCVSGVSDEDSANPDFGTWHVMVERHRSSLDKLLGKNKISVSDPIVLQIAEALRAEGFQDIAVVP